MRTPDPLQRLIVMVVLEESCRGVQADVFGRFELERQVKVVFTHWEPGDCVRCQRQVCAVYCSARQISCEPEAEKPGDTVSPSRVQAAAFVSPPFQLEILRQKRRHYPGYSR